MSLNARDTEVFVLLLCREYCEAWPVSLTETELSSLVLHVVGYISKLFDFYGFLREEETAINHNRPFLLPLTFDMEKLGEIRRPHW